MPVLGPALAVQPAERSRWQLVAGPASGGHELALTAARDRRYTAKLTEPSELSFTIDGRHPQAAAIVELTTDIHLLWTDAAGQTRILDRHRVGGNPQDVITEDSHRLQVATLDYREVLARRNLYSFNQLVWTGIDQAEIAWGLVAQTQGNAGGALGIVKGWAGTAPTGINRDRTYEAGDSVGQRIQELSEVTDGFDWDVQPASAATLRLDVFFPQRGGNKDVVLELGGLIKTVQRDVPTSDYANAIRYTGGGDTPPAPVELQADELTGLSGPPPQGRWDKTYGDDGLTTQSALGDRASWQLGQAQVIRPTYTVTLRRGGWAGPDHIWLGDTVRLIIRSGRLDVDTGLRVYEVQIDLDGDGGEAVTLALGGPRPDYRRRATAVERRLANLERR